MEEHTVPGITTTYYYFIMPAGMILTATCMKEHRKVGPPLCHQHGDMPQEKRARIGWC